MWDITSNCKKKEKKEDCITIDQSAFVFALHCAHNVADCISED